MNGRSEYMKYYFDKMYKDSAEKFYSLIKDNLNNNKKTFIVTANPETFSYGKEEDFNKLLLDENTTIVPDGIGIVKASRMLGYDVKERIPGVDIAVKLLEYSNELKKKVYLFGAKQEIIDKMKEDETVWKNYQPFSEAYKRIRIAYIEAARKRPEEFEKRLNNFISKTKENKTIIGFGGIEKYY